MLSRLIRSTGKPSRVVCTALVAFGLLLIVLVAAPGSAATPQPQSPQTQSALSALSALSAPYATCPPDGQCFADVLPGNVYYAFVHRHYQHDLVSGYECGAPNEPCDPESRPYYRPLSNVTRQQMAKFIDNARRLPGIEIAVTSGPPPITVQN